MCVFRSSYPDAKDGDDVEMKDGDLPDEKTVEFDDETLELTLPSGKHHFTPFKLSSPALPASRVHRVKLLHALKAQ